MTLIVTTLLHTTTSVTLWTVDCSRWSELRSGLLVVGVDGSGGTLLSSSSRLLAGGNFGLLGLGLARLFLGGFGAGFAELDEAVGDGFWGAACCSLLIQEPREWIAGKRTHHRP